MKGKPARRRGARREPATPETNEDRLNVEKGNEVQNKGGEKRREGRAARRSQGKSVIGKHGNENRGEGEEQRDGGKWNEEALTNAMTEERRKSI